MLDSPSATEGLVQRAGDRQERGLGLWSLARSIFGNRPLIGELAKREMTDLHAGQMGGAFWLVAHPLLMFAVYAFLFTLVFKVRIADKGPSDYVIYLFAGLAPWLITQDVMVRAAQVMLANVSIVKKVMFPSEVLVAKTLVASLLSQSILLLLALSGTLIVHGVSWILLALPALILLHLALLTGLSLLLASITPYFRDTPELLRVFVTINIYLMPVLYLPDMAPAPLQALLVANPFSHLIWCYQDVLYFGAVHHPLSWSILTVIAVLMLMSGSYVFARLRHHFASVL